MTVTSQVTPVIEQGKVSYNLELIESTISRISGFAANSTHWVMAKGLEMQKIVSDLSFGLIEDAVSTALSPRLDRNTQVHALLKIFSVADTEKQEELLSKYSLNSNEVKNATASIIRSESSLDVCRIATLLQKIMPGSGEDLIRSYFRSLKLLNG